MKVTLPVFRQPQPADLGAGAEWSRRTFIKAGAAAGGGLLLSFVLPRRADTAAAPHAESFAPNAFIRIGPNGPVTLVIHMVEMGQGVYTSLPMLIAEELEVDLDQVSIEHAPPDDKLYGNSLLGLQATGGSTSVAACWEPLRSAGATARTMLIRAAAETWRVEPATCHAVKGVVVHGPSGRRLSYGALAGKAARLPIPAKVPLKDPKDFKLIGTSAKRLDTPDKVTGRAEFGIDVKIPGMKVAAVALCPVVGGKLAHVDDSAATVVKGVRQIVRLDDAVAVIADHTGAAKKGLAALKIQWDEGSNARVSMTDIVRELEVASRRPAVVAKKAGDFSAALTGAASKVEAVYQLPFLAHATMEPMNCTAQVTKEGCEVWVGTQVMTRAQATAAKVTGLPLEKVTVHNHLLGGGFGRRLEIDGVTLAVRIAREVDGPVKVIWSRETDIQRDMYRPYYRNALTVGLDASGMPVAWRHHVTGSSITARWDPEDFKNGLDEDAVECTSGPPYACPNVLIEYVRQEPTGVPTAWWRGVGPTHNVFVVESFMDELAGAAKKDPVEYRRALLKGVPRARGVLDLAAEKASWDQSLPAGSGRGVAVQFAFGSYVAVVVEATVAKTGEVRVPRIVYAVDCGLVVNPNTLKAQLEGGAIFGLTAALFSEITITNGRVDQSNFNDYRMLRMNESPSIEVYTVSNTESPGGIGETGTAALAAALTNAIFAATGKRLRKLPVNRDELRSA